MHFAGHGEDLAGQRIGHRLGQRVAAQACPNVHLLVELIAADLAHVIAARVEEQRVEIALRALDCGRFARTELAVDLKQRLFAGLAGVALERGVDAADRRRTAL